MRSQALLWEDWWTILLIVHPSLLSGIMALNLRVWIVKEEENVCFWLGSKFLWVGLYFESIGPIEILCPMCMLPLPEHAIHKIKSIVHNVFLKNITFTRWNTTKATQYGEIRWLILFTMLIDLWKNCTYLGDIKLPVAWFLDNLLGTLVLTDTFTKLITLF